ncbi:glutamate-rich protein 1 isoform X1 [Manis pentadactyla]|uniref:glutamate-rich protein 1 isoform X1 n=1 Tax=Manis pentadactyla TaxID=143292 RepID=UPI00255D09A9|nr:glutamate-rich protein 1 isoform X1 [Manis pentadactyla]
MAALRRHVFVEKVLKRLFPNVPCGQEKKASVTLASKNPQEKVEPKEVTGRITPPQTVGNTRTQPEKRHYTASLPPQGHLPTPGLPGPRSHTSSQSSSSSDGPADQDPDDQPKRRRIRKHKSKKTFKNPNNAHEGRAEPEIQQILPQDTLRPRHPDGPTVSRNRKRKLKKKQQIKRKKAAGFLTKASGVDFMYQPEESGRGQEAVPGGESQPGPGATDRDASAHEKASRS